MTKLTDQVRDRIEELRGQMAAIRAELGEFEALGLRVDVNGRVGVNGAGKIQERNRPVPAGGRPARRATARSAPAMDAILRALPARAAEIRAALVRAGCSPRTIDPTLARMKARGEVRREPDGTWVRT